ncbi:hypothetical protein GCM10023340_14260 [Nocardioides marinquilinus]|uniref:Uncharacterized protein n=1 Tax=Nocardioides marinquilinus TaxID=1210400 RepID=A0ABP9PED2_9ACTN
MRIPPALAALALTLAALVGCSDDGDGADVDPGGDHLAEAADVLPSDSTLVEFVDRAASAERAGVGGTEVPVDDYVAALRSDDVAGSPLATTLVTADEAGVALDERGVEWSAAVTLGTGSGRAATVVSVADDVDLDAMVAELEEAGLAREEADGRTHLTGLASDLVDVSTGTIAGGYPAGFYDVTVDPDARLVVTGDDASEVFRTVDGDTSSLADGPLGDLLDGVEGNDRVRLEALPDCTRALLGGRVTPEQLERIEQEAPAFQRPLQTLLAQGDGDPQVRLLMADDDVAAADVEVRQTFLDEGTLLSSGEPIADVLSGTVTQDGNEVVVDVSLADDAPAFLLDRLALTADGPFACY